jgi:hypothetical protein
MVDSTAIAIVSVLVAGVTAIAAPALSAWFDARREARRFRDEMRARDVSALRELLDDAAVAFDLAFASRAALTKTWMLEPLAASTDLIEEVQEQRNRTVVLKARLATRLGRRHPITQAYDDAIDELDSAINPLVAAYATARISGELHSRPPDGTRAEAAGVIKRSVGGMNAAMDRFSDEAQKLAGFELRP